VRHDNGKGQQGDKRQDNGTGSTTTTTGGTMTTILGHQGDRQHNDGNGRHDEEAQRWRQAA
jgi:hypothetical protein